LKSEILDIRQYTYENKELQRAHHFLYDLRINKVEKPEYLVMGLNPGEARDAWNAFPTRTEETSLFDFMDETRRENRWTREIVEICNTDRIVQSEHFFWSSSSLKKSDFEDRFGYKIGKSPHLEYCCQKNINLLKHHSPKVVISFGFASMELACEYFNLRHLKTIFDSENKRLVEIFDDGSRVWLFARHLRSYGFKSAYKDTIKQALKMCFDKVNP
jgi:hypothetical protein